ncbi:MAG TPA: ankyrin repeat domain-containing protein [Labilithrix sp.]|nr:ankyrin repeat domain-containing protein [Labilithrix sp.]
MLLVAREQALVTRQQGGWITVYDAGAEKSFKEGCRVAAGLSKKLRSVAIHLSVFDGDILEYGVFDRGHLVDTFNSCPDYFAPSRKSYSRRTEGHPFVLKKYCRSRISDATVARLLQRDDPKWEAHEEERLTGLARALGIDPKRAVTRYSEVLQLGGPKFTAVVGEHRKHTKRVSAKTALLDAVVRQDLGEIRDLLDRKVDVNAVGAHGRTPLLNAVYHPQASAAIVKVLLDAGARVNQSVNVEFIGVGRRYPKRTALHYAAMIAPLGVVKLLIARGADVDRTDANGQTASMLAASVGRSQVVHCLLRAGAGAGPHGSRRGRRHPRYRLSELRTTNQPLKSATRRLASLTRTST